MLIDDVTVRIKAGNGGNGKVSFKRNAQTAKGGPDGGNGGNGGSVYFVGSDDITILSQFQYKKQIKAEDGVPGGKKNLYGKNAKDLFVLVPVGTSIVDLTTKQVIEINQKAEHEVEVIIAHLENQNELLLELIKKVERR